MTETQKKLRAIFLENLNRQLKTDTGISTRINLYMVEVQLLKDLVAVFVGGDDDTDENDFHDTICTIVDELHQKFDC